MRKFIVCLILSLSVNLAGANKANDFVAQLVASLNAEEQTAQEGEYDCVTVSPTMMDKVVKVMQQRESKDGTQVQNALKHVRSMRIFSATKRTEHYYAETLKMLRKNAKRYKPFQTNAKSGKDPNVWLRKDGNKVIEMVVLNRNQDDCFQIINITGDMSRQFVNELLKM
jgi:hypothetical protein